MSREKQVLRVLDNLKTEKEQQAAIKGAGSQRIESATVSAIVISMHGHDIDEDLRIRVLEPFIEEVLGKLAEDGEVAFEMRQGFRRWFKI